MEQDIKNINKFEDIKFVKRESSKTYHGQIYDGDRRILSIIYGEHALYGANHGDRKYGNDVPFEEDQGYEIMDSIGDFFQEYADPYVVSKKELMERIELAKKYKFIHEECCECEGQGYVIKRINKKNTIF